MSFQGSRLLLDTLTASAHDRKRTVEREDPVLAALLRIEAIGDQRIENDQCALSKLAAVRRIAREAIAAHTGHPFTNPLYPEYRGPSPTDLWNRAMGDAR